MTQTTSTEYQVINSSKHDYYNEKGVRVSLPVYADVPTDLRKQLLNGVRSAHDASSFSQRDTNTISNITVSTANQSNVEAYIGMKLEVLRSVLFQRGGLPLDLVLRLQEVSGIEVLTPKELTAVFDTRKKFCSSYQKSHPYSSSSTNS